MLTEIKSKIEYTCIAPTVLELNMSSLPKSQPCMLNNTDTAAETMKIVIHVSLVEKLKSVLKHHVYFHIWVIR